MQLKVVGYPQRLKLITWIISKAKRFLGKTCKTLLVADGLFEGDGGGQFTSNILLEDLWKCRPWERRR